MLLTPVKHLSIILWNITKIRNYLSQDEVDILVHAFITSRLDYYDALLYGLPQSLLDRLYYVQNCAARLMSKNKKYWTRHQFYGLHTKFYSLHIKHWTAWHRKAWLILQPNRNLRSCSKHMLVVPKSNLKTYGQRAFNVLQLPLIKFRTYS